MLLRLGDGDLSNTLRNTGKDFREGMIYTKIVILSLAKDLPLECSWLALAVLNESEMLGLTSRLLKISIH